MGLTSWKHAPDDKILKSDVAVAKNYLSEAHIKELNQIVSAYLDLAENRAERQILMKMADWIEFLHNFLELSNYPILQDKGKVSALEAKLKAEQEYEVYRIQQDKDYLSDFDKEIRRIKGKKMTINKITESEIEQFAIEQLEYLGYQHLYGPDIAPDSDRLERESFEDVLLLEQLQTAVGRINPNVPADVRENAIKQIQRLNSPELIANNEAFHRMLTEGIKVSYQKDGNSRGDLVWLIDFKNPRKQRFLVYESIYRY